MRVIDSARDYRRLSLKEMLNIKKLKPELNIHRSTTLFSFLIGTREED
jgi:PHD/YefM family antitoxin component YafN of YafNO toxin-antitoxin module